MGYNGNSGSCKRTKANLVYCECREAIPRKRLRALPETDRCVGCAEKIGTRLRRESDLPPSVFIARSDFDAERVDKIASSIRY